MHFSKIMALGAVSTMLALSPAFGQTELKLANGSGAKGSPSGDALDRWAHLIEEGTGGEVEVDVFYQNELGSHAEVVDLFVWPVIST